MRFRHYDELRVFTIVARHGSFSAAAEELLLTKGAVSHQMRMLEQELGFALFLRRPRGIALTTRGQELLGATQAAFEEVEQRIAALRNADARLLTIGVTTYFASRWLSPRLMDFMQKNPEVRLRIQPMISQRDLQREGIDLAIRWGSGDWRDAATELLFACPAWPCGNAQAMALVEECGVEQAFAQMTHIRDCDESVAWTQWYGAAGLRFRARSDTHIIPDPNVRVQAVVDGQGIALNDALIEPEVSAGRLFRLSDAALDDYGYFLAYAPGALNNPDADAFAQWLKQVGQQLPTSPAFL